MIKSKKNNNRIDISRFLSYINKSRELLLLKSIKIGNYIIAIIIF
tara:strand:- start:348 stop:482 length:135 start_codon:yes stop_codon:yes gene_type:complete